MKKLISILLLASCVLITGCQTDQTPKNQRAEEPKKQEIVIGAIAPLTGELASLGKQIQDTVKLVMPTEIKGQKVRVIWEDGKCNPADSSKATQKLVNIDKVKIILGGACSGETLGAAPITEKNQVLLLSSISTSPEVTHAGDYVFRTAPSDSSQGKALAEYANQNFKKVGILTEQTDYAVGVREVFKEAFTGEFLQEDFLSSESDFKTRITKLKASGIEALFLNPNSPAKFQIIAKQLIELRWDKPILINEIGIGNVDVLRELSDFLNTTKAIAVNFLAPESPEVQNFTRDYQATYGASPEYLNYGATTVDAVNILVQVLHQVKDPQDTEAIKSALEQIKNFPGLMGSLTFDQNGDVNITHLLLKWDGEKLVPLD